jgi:protein-S-isoprenylcysteine O-methyltransferase Ste14
MRPTFETSHVAGVLLLVVTMAWGAMELAKAGSTWEGAAGVGGGGRRIAVLPTMAAATAMLYLAPHLVPAAAIRPGAVAFAAGMVILAGGLVLRGWSIMTLGEYFTGRVMVSADQPVITAGPYRVLRHPSYFGFLLCCAGAGLASAN